MAAADPGLLLLDLLGSDRAVDPARLARLGAAQWQALDALAALHRLQPRLHRAHADNRAIPADLRAAWRDAHRSGAVLALVQDADLRDLVARLDGAGIASVVLKGTYLARHAYPEAALRPRRDVDLLVARGEILRAFAVLEAAGCTVIDPPAIALADVARLEVHMPALRTQRGTVVELHGRLGEAEGKVDLAVPQLDAAGMIARRRTVEGLPYPAAADLLDHLIVHAVYGHRLDCGPLILDDIRYLAACEDIDWPQLWLRARQQGWDKGARLLVELVRGYHGADAVPRAADEGPVPPPAALAMARQLLLQDYTTKKFARFLAALATGGLRTVAERATGRVRAGGEQAVRIDRSAAGGRLRWTMTQLGSLMRDLASPRIRRQTLALARFRLWLRQ